MTAVPGGPPIIPAGAAGQPTLYVNLEQNILYIGEAQVRLCLNEHLNRLRSVSEWQTPAAILITISITLATTKFHDFLISASTWEAIFVIVGALSAWRTLRGLIGAVRTRTSIDEIVMQMKREASRPGATHAQPVQDRRVGWKGWVARRLGI